MKCMPDSVQLELKSLLHGTSHINSLPQTLKGDSSIDTFKKNQFMVDLMSSSLIGSAFVISYSLIYFSGVVLVILCVSFDVLCLAMFHRMLLLRYFIIYVFALSLNFNK